MYSWGDEDFFENDDNRDVSAAFIGRFYENIERNHNVQYATTGFIHLVAQAKNSELLKEISLLKPLSYHPKIAVAIAMNIHCDEALQKRYFKLGGENIHEALSYNKNLAPSLVSEFLKDEELAHNVAISVKLSEELFELLLSMPTYLAQNETLTLEMQERLLSLKTPELNLSLAFNNNLNAKTIDALLALNDAKITQTVYENNATPEAILTEAYKDEKNHLALSKNENTPIEILYQLQLDSRYERHVKTNAGYGRHIQTQNIGWLV
jgi:hypothetical protein